MTWKPLKDPQEIGPAVVQYLRSTDHGHEGAHDVALAGLTVRVLPDPRTTARKRSHTIREALHTIDAVTRVPLDMAYVSDQDSDALDGFDPVAYLIGSLVLDGATNIEVDGEPVLPRPSAAGQWTVELRDDGEVVATYLGGTS